VLYLASKSPRRRALLAQLGVAFEVLAVAVPEAPGPGEAPLAYVERVARAKAGAGLDAIAAQDKAAVVLAGDTEVVLDGRIFGKPCDEPAAAAMLGALSGRTHRVISVVCCAAASTTQIARCQSRVTFAGLDPRTIARYVATGESFGKSGGYAIQGRAAAFVRYLAGSYSGVVGLPLFETAALLRRAGIPT
jgi:septum formation protein